MDMYPGYDRELVPRGRVAVRFEKYDHEFLVRYQLDGSRSIVREAAECTSTKGLSCVEHKISSEWAFLYKQATDEGSRERCDAFVMSNGIGHEAAMRRALVIHAIDGTRIGGASRPVDNERDEGRNRTVPRQLVLYSCQIVVPRLNCSICSMTVPVSHLNIS